MALGFRQSLMVEASGSGSRQRADQDSGATDSQPACATSALLPWNRVVLRDRRQQGPNAFGGNLCRVAALLDGCEEPAAVGDVVKIEMRAAPGGFYDTVGMGLDILNEASVQTADGQAASEAAQNSLHHSRGLRLGQPLGPSFGPLFGQQSIKAFLCRFHFPFGLGEWIVAVRVPTKKTAPVSWRSHSKQVDGRRPFG